MEESNVNNGSSSSSVCGSVETEPVLHAQEQDLLDPKEEFGMFGDEGMKSSSTSPLEDALLADPDSCGMCGETLVVPRVLSCLHVFCEQCLDRKLTGVDCGDGGGGGDAASQDTSITCPTCNQETKVGAQKLAALPLDITIISASTSLPPLPTSLPTSPMSGSPPLSPPIGPSSPLTGATADTPPPPAPPLLCTSCTTREPAVARCSTCHHLLCANCDKAHRYMRLFETHRVHTLEEDVISQQSTSDRTAAGIASSGDSATGKSRAGMCQVHSAVEAAWYCATCGVLCCASCASAGGGDIDIGGGDGVKSGGIHAGHQLEGVQECEVRIRCELDKLLKDARAQSQHLQAVSASSEIGSFEELALQNTSARDLITQTCHSYKAVLERCRDRALDELQTLYKERELKLMDMTEKIGKDISSLDDACRFTSKLLDNGTVSDILYLRRIVTARLQHLVRNTGRSDHHYSLEFRTDLKQFEHIARKAFGHVVTETDGLDLEQQQSSPMMRNGVGMMGGLVGKLPNAGQQGATSPPIVNLGHHNPFSVTNGNNNSIGTGSSITGGSNSSPINSLPTTTSMQSSFDGSADLQGGAPAGFLQQNQLALAAVHAVAQMNGGGTSPIVGAGGAAGAAGNGIQGFSSIAEYNLAQLASLAESSSAPGSIASATSPNPSTAAGGHGSSPFIADMFHNDTVFKNLQSLAKLGLGNDHPHGAVNGHPHGSHALTNGHQQHHHQHNMLMPSQHNGQHHHRSASPGGSSNAGSTITINTQLFAAAAAAAAASVSAATSPLLSTGTPDVDMMGVGGPGGDGGIGNGTGGSGGSGSSGAITRVNKVCPMQIRCKFGQLGATKGQFNSPHGFCLGLEEDIVVADTNNHRIQIFEKTGTFKFQFGMAGKDEGQLWYPRKVAVMRGCGKYVVCDRGNERSRMQIFTKNGHFLKKIAIRYIDIVAGLAVTAQGEIVAVDSVSPTVFVISENGDLLRWFDCSDYMREPSDIAIHGKEFYVCDFKGHNVVVFSEDGAYKRRIGWEAITSYPNGIDISDAGDVLIGDSHGNRFHVAVFSRDGPLISEFECPYVKVSRCCGLKITSEGYVVTLAKNNHHVLVLNTLYIL